VTAASLGHDVTLYEKEKRLGGQVNLAMSPPGKAEFLNIIESFENRMRREGVEVKLETELTPGIVKVEKPDVLVVATGAQPIDIKVPGIDKPHVVGAWDILMERVTHIGDNIVIIGGSATGCETAHYIAAMETPDADMFRFILYHDAEEIEFTRELLYKTGRTITVIDMVERLADNVGKTSRWSLMKSLKLLGVNLKPKTKLVEITDDEVVVESDQGQYSIPADMVITAVGARSEKSLLDSVSSNGMKVITIGDAKEPRKITEAVMEGFEEAYNL
jgi:2,4-dienoyl-CoA reductase (NADPH2)